MLNQSPIIRNWIRKEWEYHLSTGFENLIKIPSSLIRGYIAMFAKNEQYQDLDFLVKFSTKKLSEEQYYDLLMKSYEHKLFHDEPVKLLKPTLPGLLKEDLKPDAVEYVQILIEDLKDAETPNAKDVKNVLIPLLKKRYQASLKSQGGGVWECNIGGDEDQIILSIDFGGKSIGFRYELWIKQPDNSRLDFSYESLLGFYINSMDLLRTDKLEEQLEELFNNIDKAIDIVKQYKN